MPSSSDQTRVGRTLTLGGGAESSLEGRDIELSVSPKDIRTSPYNLCANRRRSIGVVSKGVVSFLWRGREFPRYLTLVCRPWHRRPL